jgi:hypothetical protein
LKIIVTAIGFCRFRQGTDYTALNQRQLQTYRLTGKDYKYAFRMKAIAAGEKPEALAKLKL